MAEALELFRLFARMADKKLDFYAILLALQIQHALGSIAYLFAPQIFEMMASFAGMPNMVVAPAIPIGQVIGSAIQGCSADVRRITESGTASSGERWSIPNVDLGSQMYFAAFAGQAPFRIALL